VRFFPSSVAPLRTAKQGYFLVSNMSARPSFQRRPEHQHPTTPHKPVLFPQLRSHSCQFAPPAFRHPGRVFWTVFPSGKHIITGDRRQHQPSPWIGPSRFSVTPFPFNGLIPNRFLKDYPPTTPCRSPIGFAPGVSPGRHLYHGALKGRWLEAARIAVPSFLE